MAVAPSKGQGRVVNKYAAGRGVHVNRTAYVFCSLLWLAGCQAAHQSGEHEVNLSIFGGNYTVDFETMQQINDDTGTARHVQRKVNPLAVTSTGTHTDCLMLSLSFILTQISMKSVNPLSPNYKISCHWLYTCVLSLWQPAIPANVKIKAYSQQLVFKGLNMPQNCA